VTTGSDPLPRSDRRSDPAHSGEQTARHRPSENAVSARRATARSAGQRGSSQRRRTTSRRTTNGAAGRTPAPNQGDAGERRHCRPVSVRRHLSTPERHRHARGRSRPVSPNTFDAVDCAPAPAASAARTPPRGYSCRTSGVSRARRSAGRDRSSGSPAGAAARARPRTNRRRWNEGVKRSPVPPARVRPGRSDVRVPPSRRTASARPGNARHLWQRPS